MARLSVISTTSGLIPAMSTCTISRFVGDWKARMLNDCYLVVYILDVIPKRI